MCKPRVPDLLGLAAAAAADMAAQSLKVLARARILGAVAAAAGGGGGYTPRGAEPLLVDDVAAVIDARLDDLAW